MLPSIIGDMAASTTTTPAAEAWALLHRLFHAQRRRFMEIAAEAELSPPQMGALLQLDPDHPVAMGDLAEALACDNSNVTGIVDRLEARGLVERRPAPHDRRVKMLAVTPEGAAARGRVQEGMSEPPEPLRRLRPGEARALRDLLRRALGDD